MTTPLVLQFLCREATVSEVLISEPEYTIVMGHPTSGAPGDVRHHPDGCTGAATGSVPREAFYSEMHRLPPCLRCLSRIPGRR